MLNNIDFLSVTLLHTHVRTHAHTNTHDIMDDAIYMKYPGKANLHMQEAAHWLPGPEVGGVCFN